MPPLTRPRILLTLLAAAAFLPFLGKRDIVIAHEGRVVQTAREMAHSGWPWSATPHAVPAVKLGNDENGSLRLLPDPTAPPLQVNPWLVPVLNDSIRLQKPPLPYWAAAVSFKIAGHWSEALARLIPALLGALGTFLIYDLARRLIGRRAALPAALVWVTSYFIPDEFRKVMADPYLAFFSLLAIWGWVRGRTLIFYVALASGVLAKGPIPFIHVGVPIVLYHILRKRRDPARPKGPHPGPLPEYRAREAGARTEHRPPIRIGLHLVGIAIFAAIALPWYAYVYRNVPHALDIWRFESVGELTDNNDNARPFFYYIPLLFQLTLPWTPLWIYAVAITVKRKRRRALLPALWYFAIVLLFSFVKLKKASYLLPATPAQTLMIAQAIVAIQATLRRRRTGWRQRRMTENLVYLSTALVIALLAFFTFVRTPAENARSPRPAADMIRLTLANDPDATVIPRKLPEEASLYLPIDLRYNPHASTILFLLDAGRTQYKSDRDAFAQRLPDLNVVAVQPIPIPGQGPKPRYQLFAITTAPGSPKALARHSNDQIRMTNQ